MGHLMRCLSLASKMNPDEKHVLISRPDERFSDTIGPAENVGWDVIVLAPRLTDAEDAAATATAAGEVGAGIIVTDMCSRAFIDKPDRLVRYHRTLRQKISLPVLSIEDCRMLGFGSNLAVVPYDCGDPDIAARADPDCRVLAGAEYYICDERLASWRIHRVVRPEASRILVALGGSDPLGVAVDVALALRDLPTGSYEVRIVAGHGLDIGQRQRLQKICETSPGFEEIAFADDIGSHLVWADLAVLGEGLIRFEAAITGTPSVTISQFEHESDVLKRFFAAGTTKYLGPAQNLTSEQIRTGIVDIAEAVEQRQIQSETGMKQYDGNGSARIAQVSEVLLRESEERQC